MVRSYAPSTEGRIKSKSETLTPVAFLVNVHHLRIDYRLTYTMPVSRSVD